MKYLTPEDCEVDILRSIYNRSNKFSLVVLVGGHSQSGKTTLVWYLCNRLCQLRRYGYKALDPLASCNTWREWDWKKYSATDAQSFVKIWNNNENAIMTLSEASTSMYYMDWMNVMSRVFNSTTTVLGKQHNVCFIDTVMESELMKKARQKIDYRIELHRREDWHNGCNIRSGWTLIDYLGMKWMLIRNNEWNLEYTKKMLLLSKEYTQYVSDTQKQNEMEENERRVGLRSSVAEEEAAQEAKESEEWVNRVSKKPIQIKNNYLL